MRTRLPAFLILAFLGLAVAAAGQAPAADPVEAAIASWRAVLDGKPAARRAALQRLADLDDPRITEILVAALREADQRQVAVVAEAIGQRPRQGAIEALSTDLARAGLPAPSRRAVAAAIARQGNRGIDLLLDLVRRDADAIAAEVRTAALQGLAAVDEERAWRGLAPLTLRGSTPERLGVLRLLEPARGVVAVTQARLRLVLDTDIVVASTAWRQLAGEGHSRARLIFEDLIERLGPDPEDAARAEMIKGIGCGIWRDAYQPLLQLAADDAAPVQTALRMVAGALAGDAPYVRWLVTEGIDIVEPRQRLVAVAIVAKAPAATVEPLLARVRAGLQHPSKDSLDFALALADLLAKDARWPDDVRRLLGAADADVRTTAFALLFDLGDGRAIAEAQLNVAAHDWQLRSVAYRYLTRHRALASIPVLIARVGKEDGRLDAELNNALFALTGVRCWTRAEWEAWWKKHAASHALPAVESISIATGAGGGSTVAYYGIPLCSKRTIFLIDVSGSMLQKIGTDRQRTRLSEAKRQLARVVEALPADQRFNVMAYEGTVTAVWDALRLATDEHKQHVLSLITKVVAGHSGTNIHDALELAFRDADVDTIYLLSDGEPTVGKLIDPTDIAEQVRRWNYARQIVVHGIAIGDESALLRRLAVESGGEYVIAR